MYNIEFINSVFNSFILQVVFGEIINGMDVIQAIEYDGIVYFFNIIFEVIYFTSI